MLRASLIAIVSRKALRLSGKSRAKHTNGQLITHISSDASFMDYSALLSHDLYIQPIQIIIGLGILIHTIGQWLGLLARSDVSFFARSDTHPHPLVCCGLGSYDRLLCSRRSRSPLGWNTVPGLALWSVDRYSTKTDEDCRSASSIATGDLARNQGDQTDGL